MTRAPWPVTTVMSCVPDADHASHADHARPCNPDQAADRPEHASTYRDQAAGTARAGRLTDAQTATARLTAAGQRVSRRTLRAAGLHARTQISVPSPAPTAPPPAGATDTNGPGMTPCGAADGTGSA